MRWNIEMISRNQYIHKTTYSMNIIIRGVVCGTAILILQMAISKVILGLYIITWISIDAVIRKPTNTIIFERIDQRVLQNIIKTLQAFNKSGLCESVWRNERSSFLLNCLTN